jgi:hypothetical protein
MEVAWKMDISDFWKKDKNWNSLHMQVHWAAKQ